VCRAALLLVLLKTVVEAATAQAVFVSTEAGTVVATSSHVAGVFIAIGYHLLRTRMPRFRVASSR
jgi:hypothetical protein